MPSFSLLLISFTILFMFSAAAVMSTCSRQSTFLFVLYEREGSRVIPCVRTIMEKHNAKDRRDKRGLTAKRRAAPAVGGTKGASKKPRGVGKGQVSSGEAQCYCIFSRRVTLQDAAGTTAKGF